jgi:hypothetical protein
MPRMAFLLAPTRHELLSALRFPLIAAPVLLVFIRCRMLIWDVSRANRRDGVDYSPEAWRLSVYVTVLFVLVAYPLTLSEYDEWFWEAHPQLTTAFIALWISSCGWICARHFELQRREDERLREELEAISHGSPPPSPAGAPWWIRLWGWGNGAALAFLSVGIAEVVRTLR